VIICQISDFHVRHFSSGDLVDTRACLTAAVDRIMRLDPAPDLVLATGDLTDHGTTEEYQLLRDTLAPLSVPAYLLPGNHDDRDTLRQVFSDVAYLPRRGPLDYELVFRQFRILVIDSSVAGYEHGEISDSSMAWLRARLAASPLPSLIAIHHPPFATGMHRIDSSCLRDSARLEQLIREAGSVRRLICGHVHRAVFTTWAGIHASICPSTAQQISLNLGAATQSGYCLEPPALHLHCWNGADFVTHNLPIAEYPASPASL
jgi:3',5'-cyclic AMP phosphodiesterase CpdA